MSSTRYSQPWISKDIKQLSRKKKSVYRRAKRSGEVMDISIYRQLQKETKFHTKRTYNIYMNDMVTPDSSTNPKKLYSFINSKRSDISGISLLKKDGVSYSDPETKAAILNEQFSTSFTKEDMTSMSSMSDQPSPKMSPFTIS